MALKNGLAVFIPAPLLRILLATIPIAIVCYFAAGRHDKPSPAADLAPDIVAARIAPVAHIALPEAKAAAGPAVSLLKGQQVYEGLCVGCHGPGLAGAPKFGDQKAWAPRIAQGYNTLVMHAINGFTGYAGMMPPKGGGANEDVEVARAVAYMANAAGAKFAEPVTLAKK